MNKLQLLVALFFIVGVTNAFASDFYAKPNNARASRTVRNSPEKPKAKEQYLTAAQVRKYAEPKGVKKNTAKNN